MKRYFTGPAPFKRKRAYRRGIGLAAVSMTMVVVSGRAQAQTREAPGVIEDIARCREQGDSQARLACFDKVAAGLAARGRGDVIVVDRAEIVERQRRGFGLPGGQDAGLPRAAGEPSLVVDAIDTSIRSVAAAPGGRWTLALVSGGTWQTAEAMWRIPEAGMPIRITRASLGGYRARVGTGKAVLVRRLR